MKLYHFLILFSIFISACSEDFFEQTIKIDVPEHTPQLAITSQMAAGDTAAWVYVTHSQGILENGQADPIVNATVELFKNGQLLETIPFMEDRFYVKELGSPLAEDGAEYQLKISADGFEPIAATQIMPTPVPILSATYEAEGALDIDGERVDEITIEFEDPGQEENYYLIYIVVKSEFGSGYDPYLHQLDPLAEQFDEGQYLKDDSFNGKKYSWRVGIYPQHFQPGDNSKIFVWLQSVSRDQYFYERSVFLAEEADDNPFAEPVIIHSNVEGGQGIFSLSAGSEVVIEP